MIQSSPDKMEDVTPNLLWHYTDFDGFYGIITKGIMHATDIAYLNDKQEFDYTLHLAAKIFYEMYGHFKEHGGRDFVVDGRRMLRDRQTVYVSSFSSKIDDLSQWRGYAHASPSFSIGFDRNALQALDAKIVRCEYDPVVQENEIRSIVQAAHDAVIERYKAAEPPQQLYIFMDEIWRQRILFKLIGIAERNKSPKFFDEAESRVTLTTRDLAKVNHRKARSMIVPYIEWETRPGNKGLSPIRCVVVGPSPNQWDIFSVTCSICKQQGIPAKVVLSEVPYRF